MQDVRHVRADLIARSAYEEDALATRAKMLKRAAEIMPSIPDYYRLEAITHQSILGSTDDLENRASSAESAYVARRFALEADRMSGKSKIAVAGAALELGRLGYPGYLDEAIGSYQSIARLAPNHSKLQAHLMTTMAVAHIENGDSAKGLELLDKAMTYEPSENKMASILYFRAVALKRLGRDQEAVADLTQAVGYEHANTITIAESHLLLSQIYLESGDRSLSQSHADSYEVYLAQTRE